MMVSVPLAARRAALALALIVPCVVAAPAPASAVGAPAGLAFYSPPKRLLAGAHGSVIWARRMRGPLGAAGREYLVLYRSRSIDGRPIAVSGLVDVPKRRAPAGGWPVVSWAHGASGVADVCAPSRSGFNAYVYPQLNAWLRRGWAIASTDYEGLGPAGTHPLVIGRSEGRGVLDIVRAARRLDSGVGRRFAIAGHSQGGHAALWAAALAPRWTPELNLRGLVAFAPASHTGTLIRTVPAGLGVLIIVGAAAADPDISLDRVLSDQALALLPLVRRECVFDLVRDFEMLAPSQLERPGADLSRLFGVLDAQNPALTIRHPVLIIQGEADQIVPPPVTRRLVGELKAKGDAVTYRTYPGVDHLSIVAPSASAATAFLAARLG
jgi:pimeloyl-ACP methyl ester carboxylesterase